MSKQIEDRYLGDGVHASFDGWHVWLDLRSQGDSHIKIALEPGVMSNLRQYQKEAYAAPLPKEATNG